MWEQMGYESESVPKGFVLPKIKEIALAEIISLIPILALIFISIGLSFIPPDVRAYSPVVGENLFYWFIVLVVFTFQGFFGGMSGGGRGYGTRRWNTGRGGWGSSRGGFGGGRSGGGGSSKKF